MVKLGSTIESSRKDGRLANSDNIYDKISGKMQEDINREVSALSPVDEEDLTRSFNDNGRSVTKFADRSYSPQNFSGKGYKILRKNIKPVSLAITEIVVSSVPTSDGYLAFIINGVESHVDVVASTDTTTDKVAEKIATKLKDTIPEYDVSKSASTITLTRKFGGIVSTPSSFSAVGTGASCGVKDYSKIELRNILTAVMINQPNTIYEIRYDFDLDGKEITIQEGCVLKFCGGCFRSGVIVFNNTIINSKDINCIKRSIEVQGSIANEISYLNWFDADGDGVVDDTIPLRNCFCHCINTVVVPNGTYIINIQPGVSNKTPRIFFESQYIAKKIIGIGNATIKLGKDNCDTRIFKGFAAIFHLSGDYDYVFENITFDFNYKDNPIYQYTSNNIGVEVNGQQIAIEGYKIASLSVKKCTFIEPSGTNTVTMRGSATSDHLYYNVEKCKFIDVGKKSFFNNSETQAYHDASTLGCHSAIGGNPNAKFYVNISDNYANGAGGNSFDFCEFTGDYTVFKNNVIENYYIGCMPLTCGKYCNCRISNNKFVRVGRAIGLWNNTDKISFLYSDIIYDNITIDNNYVIIDIDSRLKEANWTSINNKVGEYYIPEVTRYGLLVQMQALKSVNCINITNNHVEYIDYSQVPDSVFAIYRHSCINMVVGTSAELILKEINICNNIFKNTPNNIVRNGVFSKVENVNIQGNIFLNVFNRSSQAEINDGLFSINSLHEYSHKIVSITDNIVVESKKNGNAKPEIIFGEFGRSKDGSVVECLIYANNIIEGNFKEEIKVNSPQKVIYKSFNTLSSRPTYNETHKGVCVFDTNLNKPIWWTGTKWVDATGADV